MDPIKLTFQQNALLQYLAEVKQAMQIAVRRTRSVKTEALLNSIAYQALKQVNASIGKLSFKEYGRFLDMGVGRGHPLGGIKTTTLTLASTGRTGIAQINKKNTIPRRKIYSPIAYGKLNWLMGKLAHGYTEEAIDQIKKQMTNGNNQN